ncbi:hypothetical protein LCGC14_0872650 [marine sediment metagenome]|uniref:Uncharacterized protein n=1 Tax=marine sediment metagenome TaxID=412755 RepID=A0A0F9PPT2_9ZZZZ
MPEQIDLFVVAVVAPDPNHAEFKKFKRKLLREGYTLTKKKADGCMVETFTRRKQKQ